MKPPKIATLLTLQAHKSALNPSSIQDTTQPPRTTGHTVHECKEYLEWTTQQKKLREPITWHAWLNHHYIEQTAITSLTKKAEANKLDPSNRTVYTVFRTLCEARQHTSATFWRSENKPLICPCLAAHPTSLHPRASNYTQLEHAATKCTKRDNPVGLVGTHDEDLWRTIIREEELSPKSPIAQPNHAFFCLCGSNYPNIEELHIHIATTRDTHTHGIFFDDLPKVGGAYIIFDLQRNIIVHTEALRIPVRSTHEPDSTWAEGETYAEALATAIQDKINDEDIIEPGHHVLISTDSDSLVSAIKTLAEQEPTVAQVMKSPIGPTLATIRTAFRLAEPHKINIATQWDRCEHDRTAYDNLQDLITKLNKIMDNLATTAMDIIRFDPDSALPPLKQDYGSCADYRATRPPTGHGLPIIFTFNGLICQTPSRRDTSHITSAENTLHLAASTTKTGSLARLITKGQIHLPASANLRTQAPSFMATAAARFSLLPSLLEC